MQTAIKTSEITISEYRLSVCSYCKKEAWICPPKGRRSKTLFSKEESYKYVEKLWRRSLISDAIKENLFTSIELSSLFQTELEGKYFQKNIAPLVDRLMTIIEIKRRKNFFLIVQPQRFDKILKEAT